MVIVKRVWRRHERGDPEVPHQEKNFALHALVRLSALQEEPHRSTVNFPNSIPPTQQENRRVWVHLKREGALPLDERIYWSWLRFGAPLSMCLSCSTATLDVTLVFEDAVHAHLSMWMLRDSQLPHLVLHRDNRDPSQDWRKRQETGCWPPRELSRLIITTDFHRVYSSAEKRKRPGRKKTSSWSQLSLPDQCSPHSSTHRNTHSREKRDQERLGLPTFFT